MRMVQWLMSLALMVPGVVPALGQQTKAPAPREPSRIVVETYAKDLTKPWGFQFLPDGRMLVTEIRGTMRIVDKSGSVSAPVKGVPAVVAQGQGGLLDVALAPDHATSGIVYLSFSEARGGGRVGTSIARGRLMLDEKEGRLDGVTVIFQQKPDYAVPMHFGSRFAFARDGSLFVTLGERNTGRESGSMQLAAQNPANHFGKVVRLNADGSPHAADAETAELGCRGVVARSSQSASRRDQSRVRRAVDRRARCTRWRRDQHSRSRARTTAGR